MGENRNSVVVPPILRRGRRGVDVKIWTFLFLNRGREFTAREISEYLNLPLSTAQLSLRVLISIAPSIDCQDLDREGRGRPEKSYRFLGILPS